MSLKLTDEELRRRENQKILRKRDETERARQFGENLRKAMKQSDKTLNDIQKETMINSNVLYNYLRGRTSPKAYNVLILAKALNFTFGDLYPL